MSTDFFLSWQFGMTLLAALAVGIALLVAARRARARRGEQGHVGHPTPTGGHVTHNTPQR